MLDFERPEFLWLLGLLVPIVALSWRSRLHEGAWRWATSLALRTLVVLTLVGSLSLPSITRESEAVATAFVLDRSASVPAPLLTQSRALVETLAASKQNREDQFAVITVAAGAEISAPPVAAGTPSIDEFSGSREATDLAAGLRRAISVLPPGLMKRVMLVSDGNETAGNLLAEAEIAAARGIPVDVVPLDFKVTNEVLVESLRAPTRARPGQTAELRMVIRSQHGTSGTIFLRDGTQLVDLDPARPGDGLAVALEPGVQTIVLPFPLGDAGTHRFQAVFEPNDLADDRVLENNVGTAVTFIDGPPRVLVVDPTGGTESGSFVTALTQASIRHAVVRPEDLVADSAFLSGFDAIVLANVPRWSIDGELDRLLRAYVHDVGGGLLVLGGPDSLGAGGWISSEVAEVLPVLLDAPGMRTFLRGSVAIVLDASGSMASAAMGAFVDKQAMANEAAAAGVRSMSHLDEVSVITFGGFPQVLVPRRDVGRNSYVEQKIRGITSGGGTDLHAAMQLALDELRESTAGTKHMILLTDGMTVGAPETGFQLAKTARDLGITVSAIGIEEGALDLNLKQIAEIAGGRFHPVTDLKTARELPEIFIREFTEYGRRRSVEGDFSPTVRPATSGPLRGFTAVPPIGGYAITVPRDGLAEVHVVQATSEGVDPIFASWNHGLGRTAVFASDAGARWATAWPSWSEYRAFWEQTVRWLMRPVAPTNATMRTRIDGEQAIVEVSMMRPDGGFDVDAEPQGSLIGPDGKLRPLALAQVGAGRWRGEFDLKDAGTYLANVALNDDELGRRASVSSAVNAPYAREFRSTGGNRALLEAVAARTGGRVIELASPSASIDAFLRSGTKTPLLARGLWDVLAMLAALLFLVDVAFRRVLFDWSGMRAAARGGWGGRTPGDAALAALGQIRRRPRADRGAAGIVPDAGATQTRPAAVSPRAAEVETSATTRTPTPTRDPAPQPSSAPLDAAEAPASIEGEAGADSDSTAARLLRAKRRAGEGVDRRPPR